MLVVTAQVAGTLAAAQVGTMQAALAATTCMTATTTYDTAATLTGPTNSYFTPPNGTAAAGATTITLSSTTPDTAGGGASTAIAVGNMLLLIQMQDGTFTYSNSSSYGSGGSISSAGLYEYVAVSAVSGTTITIQGTGAGGGLLNSYHEAAATSTHGQEVYQIIRVPQYVTTQLTSNFRSAYWDGKTGGVAAIDVSSTLNLGGANIYANANGFRGAGASVSSTTPTSVLNSDWVDSATMNGTNPSTSPPGFGFKGEGIFGTPDYNYYYTVFTTPSAPSGGTIAKATSGNGYPGGDVGMGAPGSAGGGGTDMDPASNDQNTGGGGGGNGGAGGNGGYPWTPNYTGTVAQYSQNSPGLHAAASYAAADSTHNPDIGGRGGASVSTFAPIDIRHAYMGGGGGGGSNNNGSGTNGSSGGPGGGIVLMRIADTSGSAATIYAQGATGNAPSNDGGGGGGAGGTVIITSPAAFSGITVHADGAIGTTANAAASPAPGGVGTQQHGPGGGGGGGIVITSSPVTATVSGGAAGTTTTAATTYGAQPGSPGLILAGNGAGGGAVTSDDIPGISSGAECYSSTGAGTVTMYNGPYDSGGGTYKGSNYTGSYDGAVSATNNNDFVAIGMPLTNTTGDTGNDSSVAGSPLGGTFTYTTLPTINAAHEFYYNDTAKKTYHLLTFTAQAPVLPGNWNVKLCQSNAGGTASACAAVTTNACSATANQNTWVVVSNSASNLDTAKYCYYSGKNGNVPQVITYWTAYTPASGTYTAFQRYDSVIHMTDDSATPVTNATHTEMYAGYVVLTKNTAVVSSGCPAGEKPTYASGVCPGGVLRYTVDYRSIVAGAALGTQGAIASLFPFTSAGKLVLTDDGTATTSSSTTAANWASFSSGMKEALHNNLGANNALCGDGASHCGDSNTGSTFLYYTGIPASGAGSATFPTSPAQTTKFSVTTGGTTFSLYPPNFAGKVSQGTITFAVTVK